MKKGFVEKKAQLNHDIIKKIKNYALTKSSSEEFNRYAGHTFLDNILRGGLPVSLKTGEGNIAFNVYSRKHGDLERDYNHFVVAPTFYSQGNGNYRDVNQNRRNDVWFNSDVNDGHLVSFLNLSQADGYNPLVVKGTSFTVKDKAGIKNILEEAFNVEDRAKVQAVINKGFLPGELLDYISRENIIANIHPRDFLGRLLEKCQKQELADHGEGFWSDHWTYNLDLIESYLAVYPEQLKRLLIDTRDFYFYLNSHYVLPRDQRYILTDVGVRQYESVTEDEKTIQSQAKDYKLRGKNGEGAVYQTNLTCKLLCLIANKVATLDPSGIGVEMEADKPNWYDALNGLPGLLGSSISETFEVKRFAQFLLESLKQIGFKDTDTVPIFEELANFVDGLSNLLSLENDAQSYWSKANDIKEHYRKCVRVGISGTESAVKVEDLKEFLALVIKRTTKSAELARTVKGELPTYFFHEVSKYQKLDKRGAEGVPYVKPQEFIRHDLPLFLEGYVHALRVCEKKEQAQALYDQVRSSDLFDKKTKMYRVNINLSDETEEIGRTRIFPTSWLENGSIWLHMEYKFVLELLRNELFEAYYENFKSVLVPFLKPEVYGRSILENSSFIVSSSHEDESLHGRGFVARLSGSTAEFLHMWLLMNAGKNPFTLNAKKELTLQFKPALPAWIFNDKAHKVETVFGIGQRKEVALPAHTYAFNFLGSTLVVYHNPKQKDTFGPKAAEVKEIRLTYHEQKKPIVLKSAVISAPYSHDVRDRKVRQIDVYFGDV
ncbi:MAG: hypothetical protein KC618_02525, partial [Candidatus Omnitrophica bacterium]|nr:hypothetical protein [Candidatus Omnitrophota bacterium]